MQAYLFGRDKTSFSTDYMHSAHGRLLQGVPSVEVFPPEKGLGDPAENFAAEHIWALGAILGNEYGWCSNEVRGFLGEDLYRAFEANWN